MNIKSILRKAAYGYKAESSSYIEHLRSIGMKIEAIALYMFRQRR